VFVSPWKSTFIKIRERDSVPRYSIIKLQLKQTKFNVSGMAEDYLLKKNNLNYLESNQSHASKYHTIYTPLSPFRVIWGDCHQGN
jgi:hypothetical protein